MFLKNLNIIVNWKVIRSITFKEWLNLITSSWNSVWKTTLLRAIDYCFWSNWEDFYKDSEFKENWNTLVYNFLKDNEVYFQLTFSINNNEFVLNRGFSTIINLTINNEKFSDITSYNKELNRIIFWINNDKPSFRDMITKFIRKDILRMKHMIKTLHHSKSKDDYMLFYFQLFNFKNPDLIFDKYFLEKQKKKVSEKLTNIKDWNNKNSIKQRIKLLDVDILELNTKIQKLDLIWAWDYSLDKLSNIQEKLYGLRTKKWNLNLKLSLNKDSLNLLSNQKSNIDTDFISEIYNNASVYIWKLNKTLEETILFHNKMVDNKITFITHKVNEINTELEKVWKEIKILEKEESEILNLISDKDKFSNLYKIQNELTIKAWLKWEEKKLLDLIESLEKEKEEVKNNISQIDEKIKLYYKDFEENLFVFNKYFKKYSNDVYWGDYYISFTDDYKDVVLWNIDYNVGGWEKKAYIWLFDFAYISYLNEIWSTSCKFIIHDSVEDTNPISLSKIFNLSNNIWWQYIVSILKDKINTIWYETLKDSIILELNEDNKFFQIEKFNWNHNEAK